jgi:hypothetical protein
MRSLLSLLGVFVLVLLVVGFFRGWFTIAGDGRGAESSKVTLTVDADKVKDDAEKAKDKTMELSGRAKAEAKDLSGQAKDGVKSSPG